MTDLANRFVLNSNGMSPLDGYPVFVLDSKLQSGQNIGSPNWEPHSRAGVYIGCSAVCAGNVALALNLQTGHVSPQYHL
eukprot:15366648-Ditylum_brightwellii.AAC.1